MVNRDRGFFLDVDGQLPFDPMSVDRFLREISDTELRKHLVNAYGTSPSKISAFETERGLPAGAFEVVLMLGDDAVQASNQHVRKELAEAAGDEQRLMKLQSECDVMAKELRAKYPRATSFLDEYQQAILRSTGDNAQADPALLCQFVIPIVAVAVAVVVGTVAAATVAVAANAAAAANAVSVVNTFAVTDGS